MAPCSSSSFLSRQINSLLSVPAVLCVLLSVASPASAVTYVYTGNPLLSENAPPVPGTFPGLTISFNVPGVLGPNFSGDITQEVLANGFSLSFPNQPGFSVTTTQANVGFNQDGTPRATFNVTTDSTGHINTWNIIAHQGTFPDIAFNFIGSCSNQTSTPQLGCGGTGGFVSSDQTDEPLGCLTCAFGNTNNPGTWTLVPEPSTLMLEAPPLALIGASVWTRRCWRGASRG